MENGVARGTVSILAVVLVAIVAGIATLGSGDDPYTVTARFVNSSQLVVGNQVLIGGVAVGSVEEITLDGNGEALVEMTVDDEYAPLRRGTVATVRSFSLVSIAGRLVELTLPPKGAGGEEIPSGGALDRSETVSAVDIDAVFNTLDEPTVSDLKDVVSGLERSFAGSERQANEGLRYLNPLLSSSRRAIGELNRDQLAFERLLVDTSRLSGALAERSPDVSGLVHNLSVTTGALASERDALTTAIDELPEFLRRFNTTAVNLRAAFDDLDPLVTAARPVATRLRPFFSELRSASADLVPTVRDLDALVRRPGPRNDLVETTRLQVPLERIAVGPVKRNGARRAGALPASARALGESLTMLGFLRAYTPELLGWFNDFGTSGTVDANGGLGRIMGTFNTFSASTPGFPEIFSTPDTPAEQLAGLDIDNNQRCPGSLERDPGDGSTPFDAAGALPCDPLQVPVGP